MDETRYWMWARRKLSSSGGGVHLPPPPPPHQSSNYDSWEEQAFAEDAAGVLGGCVWPPRSYSCTFCRREFRSAQALGGHMNVHRRDRARLKQSSSPTSPNPEINSGNCNHHHHLLPSRPYYSPPHPHNIYPLLQNPTPNPNPNPNSNPNHKINDVVAASTSLSPSKMTAAVASHLEESSREKGLQLLPLSSSSYASSSNNIVQENNSNHFLFSTRSYLSTQNPTMSRLKLRGEDLKLISREACGKRKMDRSTTEEEEEEGGGGEEDDEEGERINKRQRTTDHGSTGPVCYLLDPKLGSHLPLPLPSEGIECSRGPAVPEELDLELRLGNHHHHQQQQQQQQQPPNDHHPVSKKNCSKLLA